MSDFPQIPNPKELEILFQALEDGVASREELDRLARLLRTSPEVREAYCEHMLFAAALHTEAVDRQRLMEEDVWPIQRRSKAWRIGVPVLAAAALLVLAGVVLSLFAVKPPPRALVRGSEKAQWSFEAGGIDETRDFTKDSRMVVERGTVRLDFSSGTSVWLDAPATLVIRTRMEVELEEGQGWFDVAKSDKGFSVLTKTLRAVDLGTSFGIATARIGAEVHVTSGEVRVESRLPNQEAHVLGEGMAMASDAVGYLKPAEFDSGKFSKNLSTRKRIAHWSFDGNEPLQAKTSSGEHAFITVEALKGSADAEFTAGAKGMALDLGAKGTFAASSYRCPLGSSPRTVAFWFQKKDMREIPWDETGHRNPPVLSWGNDQLESGKWQLNTTGRGSHFATNWGGSWNVSHMEEGTSLVDGRWHHLAAVFTGEEIDGAPEIIHYLNGIRMPESALHIKGSVRTRPHPENWRQLVIGYFEVDGSAPGTIPMQIDELVIADFALPEEMILKLAQGDDFEFGE